MLLNGQTYEPLHDKLNNFPKLHSLHIEFFDFVPDSVMDVIEELSKRE